MNIPFLKKIISHKVILNEKSTIQSLWRLQKIILSNLDFNEVVKNSVNGVLTELGYLDLGYKIIVLALIDERKQVLERIDISETEEARKALQITPVPFHDIIIPLGDLDNISIKAIRSASIQITTDWRQLLTPVYTPEEAIKVQQAVGIKTSMIYPVMSQGKPIGTLIFSMSKDYKDVSQGEKDILGGFTDLVGLAVQRSLLFNSLQNTTKQLGIANQRLQELDHLKDDFVSIASHELRTPMTAIRSYVWMALNRPDITLSEKMKKYLSRTLISTERLINLVNDMLNLSRIESGRIEVNPKAFDIGLLIDEVMVEVEPKASEKAVKLQVIKNQIPQAFADPDKVHQVLLNLLGNALKFTPAEGLITINFFSDGQAVEVAVKDSGVGISKDDQSRLFKKFERLDNSYVAAATTGGTGLGLYISKSLIELMHGKIWAQSEGLGKGSVFTFSLPIATPTLVSQAEKYTVRPSGEAKGLEPVAM